MACGGQCHEVGLSLEELLEKCPAQLLDKTCEDQHLVTLSLSLSNWSGVSPFLGLSEADDDVIKHSDSSIERQRVDVLRMWKNKIGTRATYRLLAEALYQAMRVSLIEELCSIVNPVDNLTVHSIPSTSLFEFEQLPSPDTQAPVGTDADGSRFSTHNRDASNTSTLTKQSSSSDGSHNQGFPEYQELEFYSSYLKSRYTLIQSPISSFQWPPPPTHKIFNLAIIERERVQRGGADDDFVRMIITGNVDEILHVKTPVKLEDIFTQITDGRKLVLIEGAPGSGKSTLCWSICELWAKGQLFQEYQIVVLVRLRDPLVQKARTIADLLPSASKTMAIQAAETIITNLGMGVLWVLDGWDELPSDLPRDSLLQMLIQPELSQESPLIKSAVIITSRPISSAQLHPLLSLRVEVIVFTQNELREYFKECLKGDSEALETLLERIQDNPIVEGSCYLPLIAAIVVHLFLAGDQSLPTTSHGFFTSVVLHSFCRYLQDRLGMPQQTAMIKSLKDIPHNVQGIFQSLHKLAYSGVVSNKVTFCTEDLKSLDISEKVCEVGLLQAVPSLVSHGVVTYFNFNHLSIQEMLSGYHISCLSATEQIAIFKELFNKPRFLAVFEFYAGFTKLRATRKYLSLVPKALRTTESGILEIVRKICRDRSKPVFVSLLRCLYEAQDPLLCKFVADQLRAHSHLYLFGSLLHPLDCLSVGYLH